MDRGKREPDIWEDQPVPDEMETHLTNSSEGGNEGNAEEPESKTAKEDCHEGCKGLDCWEDARRLCGEVVEVWREGGCYGYECDCGEGGGPDGDKEPGPEIGGGKAVLH